MDFNNRELAVLVWTGIVLILMLRNRPLRASLGSLARTVLQRVILLPVLVFAVYVAGWCWVGARVEAWNWELINETIWWFLVTGFVLFFGALRVAQEDDFFIRTAKRALTVAIFAEFFINLVVMPFWAEFFLLPIITFIAVMQVFVERKEEYAAVKKLADNLSGDRPGSICIRPDQLDHQSESAGTAQRAALTLAAHRAHVAELALHLRVWAVDCL